MVKEKKRMDMKLIEFNRRGFICALNNDMDAKERKKLTKEERVMHQSVIGLHAKYFVVMKRISEKEMLVAPVFTSKRKNCKKIHVNNKEYWVNFMTFYVVPEKIFQAVPGKYLDHSYKTITDIYTSHNNTLKEKWRKEHEKRLIQQEMRRRARERKQNEHRYNMDYLYPIPEYMQKAARTPCYAGAMSAR